jgi:phosphate transport system protein
MDDESRGPLGEQSVVGDEPLLAPDHPSHLERDIDGLRRRLGREAVNAVGMLEAALDALWRLDRGAAKEIRRRDDTIDTEEVAIEEMCLRLMTLQQPFARDARTLTFVLKVNQDIERVADHGCSIAKIVLRLRGDQPPDWPVALRELGQRVPMMCHALLRAMANDDEEAARGVVSNDEIIDELDRRLFEETLEWMKSHPDQLDTALLMMRIGRELERVGDLMTNIAEDIVYVRTGAIIRHEKRRVAEQEPGAPPAPGR